MGVWEEAAEELKWDQAAAATVPTSTPQSDPWDEAAAELKADKSSGFMKEFLKGIPATFLKMGEGMIGTADSLVQIDPAVAKQYGAWAPRIPGTQPNKLADKLHQMGENIESTGSHFSPTGTSFGAWAGQVLGQAVPYVAMAAAGGGAGLGAQLTAAGLAFFAEGEDAHDNAITSGATEEEAQLERFLVGGINGVIEAAQVGNILRFSKGGKVGIRNLIRMARSRAYPLIAAQGKKLTVDAVKMGLESAIEEMVQEGSAMIVPGVLRDEGYEKKLDGSPDFIAIASRLAQAGAAGLLSGAVIGGGSALTGVGELARPTETELKSSADRINNSNLSPIEKGRALQALQRLGQEDTPGLVAEDITPDITLDKDVQETLDVAAKVEEALSSLDINLKGEAKAMSEERGKRFSAYEKTWNDILASEPNEQVAQEWAMEELAGQLKMNFDPLKNQISVEDMNKLFAAVRTSNLMTGQKLNLTNMINTVFNKGQLPQRAQMKAFDQLFGTTMSKTMDKKMLTNADKVRRGIEDTLNIPRAMLASMDFSAAGRQGWLLFHMSPYSWAKATVAGYRAALNPEYADFMDLHMRSNPYFSKFVGLDGHYSEEGAGEVEGEAPYASRFIDKIPGIKPSERAYRTTLNMLRLYNFQRIAESWEGTNKTTNDYQKLVKFLNHATGRGDLPGFMKKNSDLINIVFFAPRLQTGIVQTWTDMFHGSPEARKIIAGTLLTALGSGLAVLGLAAAAGIDVEWDPRSADWGLIRIGDTRINFWGPHQTMMKFIIQYTLGKKKSATGHIYDKERGEIMWDFLATKLNAGPALVNNLNRGYDMFGERIHPTVEGIGEEVLSSIVPLVWQDIYDAATISGAGTAAIISPLAVHGIGAMTYQQRESSRDTSLKNSYAQRYFGVDWLDLGPEGQKAIRIAHQDVGVQEQRKKIEQMDYVSDVKFAEESRQSALRVKDTMSSKSVDVLTSLDIPVPGVGRVLGTNWLLTMKRAKEYEKETAEMLDLVISRVQESPGWGRFGPDAKRNLMLAAIKLVKDNVKANIMNRANMKDIERRQDMIGGQDGRP